MEPSSWHCTKMGHVYSLVRKKLLHLLALEITSKTTALPGCFHCWVHLQVVYLQPFSGNITRVQLLQPTIQLGL